MDGHAEARTVKRTLWVTSLCIGLLVALATCGDDPTGDDPTDESPTGDRPTFELTFTGDASFQGPHAGDRQTEAIICTGGDGVGASSGAIFAPPETISFRFGSTVLAGASYQIYLWIDSNIGGGTEGVCDPPSIDHQWVVTIPPVTGDVNIIFSHDDATVTDVCSAFDADQWWALPRPE